MTHPLRLQTIKVEINVTRYFGAPHGTYAGVLIEVPSEDSVDALGPDLIRWAGENPQVNYPLGPLVALIDGLLPAYTDNRYAEMVDLLHQSFHIIGKRSREQETFHRWFRVLYPANSPRTAARWVVLAEKRFKPTLQGFYGTLKQVKIDLEKFRQTW